MRHNWAGIAFGIVMAAAFIGGLCCILQKRKS